jgi:hypothetical protein
MIVAGGAYRVGMAHDGTISCATMEVLYEYFSIFFFVRAFLTFLCMDMGGQQFFSALEMRWMM